MYVVCAFVVVEVIAIMVGAAVLYAPPYTHFVSTARRTRTF